MALVVTAGCGGGVNTGSVAEFCDDWVVSQELFGTLDTPTTDDLDALIERMRDMRYPDGMEQIAEDAVATMVAVRERVDGLDLGSAEAGEAAASVDDAAVERLDSFADERC